MDTPNRRVVIRAPLGPLPSCQQAAVEHPLAKAVDPCGYARRIGLANAESVPDAGINVEFRRDARGFQSLVQIRQAGGNLVVTTAGEKSLWSILRVLCVGNARWVDQGLERRLGALVIDVIDRMLHRVGVMSGSQPRQFRASGETHDAHAVRIEAPFR